jgi:hypothetical protein
VVRYTDRLRGYPGQSQSDRLGALPRTRRLAEMTIYLVRRVTNLLFLLQVCSCSNVDVDVIIFASA